MGRQLYSKFKEAFTSVFPIVLIVILLHFTIAPLNNFYTLFSFLIGAFMLMIGMTFFTLGADISMMPIGEKVGSNLTKTRNLLLIVIVTFIIGFIITTAEPDLKVLARQTPAVPDNVLIMAVSFGVGLFLVAAFLRILFQIKLAYILIFFYIAVFILSYFTDANFLAVAFDSGGVTTGPITVPFIMSLGVGLAAVRGDKTTEEDSFGLVSLCSVGPIIIVLILGMLYNSKDGNYIPIEVPDYVSCFYVLMDFLLHIPEYAKEVAASILPIVAFFVVFQIFSLKLKKKSVIKIFIGLFYTYLGLVIFLTGVNVGFMPAGYLLGNELASGEYMWILIPLGAIIGYFIVAAEPAVHVLKQQVEDMTEGAVTGKAMGISLSVGVALSVGIALMRVIFGISILYILLPGYIFALIITFFVKPIFSSIAFDSGGVASGPMTATFLLPFSMGACDAVEGGNILLDAFGIVAMVAMTPVITIQILGIIYKLKERSAIMRSEPETVFEDSIIDFNSDEDVSKEESI